MKLIIDIPETMIQALKDGCFGVQHNVYELAGCIMNGTPLDNNSERAEVQAYFGGEAYGWEQGRKALIDDVKAEIDEQYDRVHPYNIDVAQGLEMALDILDRISKAESEV